MSCKDAKDMHSVAVNMYKQGFLDGYCYAKPKADPLKAWDKIKDKCRLMFERIFEVDK